MVAALLIAARPADAQDNPVYVNDSPAALAQLRQAEDQIRDNPGEAVRLFQELLDEFPMKLVPVTDGATDQFVSVRRRVLRDLRGDESLLERYRLIATPQAQRMLESGQLTRLAVTRPLTEPGLQAMLMLAQQKLESASFDAALNWLDQAREHPDCTGRSAAHVWYMTALATNYLNDARTQQARQQLIELGDRGAALLKQLDTYINDGGRPRDHRGINVLDRTAVDDVDDLIAQPIWWRRLDETLLHRRLVDPSVPESQRNPVLERHRQDADLMTTTATVCGDFVYVNEGFRVTAYDRFMGDMRWSYLDTPSLAMLDRDSDPPLDLSIIAVSGDSLVTYTGHAHATQRSGTGGVLCLDRFTGELRWETSLENILPPEDPDDLFPHGAPIVTDGAVYTLARKVSRQRLTSTYMVAFDLHDGRVLWSRYLTSSGGLHRAGRPVSSPTWSDGWLYVATSIGAVARLDPTTGEIDWMRRFNVPINIPFQEQMRRPWECSSPVVTPLGVLAMQPDNRRVVLLNRYTGDTIESFPATVNDAWGEVRYLLANDTHVYAVGREIRAFALDALARPQWTLPPPRTSRYVDDQTYVAASSDMTALDIRGRVQVVDGMLVVPSLQGALFVDSETGTVNHRLLIDPGNPVAVGAQLFYVGSDRLDAYMSFDRAQEMLRQRIDANPDDPAPALSLLRLGIRVDDLGLALSAADMAQHAIQLTPDTAQSSTAQQELFSLLLSIDELDLADTPQRAEALYAVLGTVAVGARQRVEYLLAYGDWLSAHDVGQAVETYQRLLSDPQLASVVRAHEQVKRAAVHWGTLRLRNLMQQRGAQVYAAQADFAQRRFEQLAAQTPINVDALLNLGREYPFSAAAVQATQLAVDRMLEQGRNREAVGALLTLYRLTELKSTASPLLGRAVQLCAANGWLHDARDILTYLQDRFETIDLPVDGAARSIDQWREVIADATPGPQRAELGRPGDVVRELLGNVVPMHPLSAGAVNQKSFLVVDGTVLTLYDAAHLTAQWNLDLSHESTTLLDHRSDRIVLWQEDENTDQLLAVVDPADGSVRWISPSLFKLFGTPDERRVQSRRLNEQLPDGRAFDPAESLPLLAGDRIVIVRRIGGAVAFDVGAGREPIWKLDDTLDQVHYAQLSDTALVLAGIDRAPTGRTTADPKILVLDPSTGRTLRTMTPAGEEPARWMQIGPLGRLVYGNENGIEAVDLFTGRPAWTNVSYEATESANGWVVGNDLVYQQRTRLLCSADLDSGVLGEEFNEPMRNEQWDPYDSRQVIVDRNRVYVLYSQRVVCYSSTGRMLGQDVVVDDRDYRWLLPAAQRLVLISADSEQLPAQDQIGKRTQYLYRLYSISANCRLLGNPVDVPEQRSRVERADLVDGWVLLSTNAMTTLAVPMPGEPVAAPDDRSEVDDAGPP